MSIIQVTGSTGSVGADRTPFYGGQLPSEVKAMLKPLAKLDKKTFRGLLQMVVNSLERVPVEFKNLKDLESSDFTIEILSVVYTGIHTLLNCALKLPASSLKQENFKEDLTELQIPVEFHKDLSSVVFGERRANIEVMSINSRPRLPQLETLKWRVDVGISTSVLNRVLEPSVLMELTLTDGKVHQFEVPVSKFHELRYNVAYVLKEMEDLEKRSILQIKD